LYIISFLIKIYYDNQYETAISLMTDMGQNIRITSWNKSMKAHFT